jgi:hypothetical protein
MKSLGFHSVEFMFFVFIGIFGLVTILWLLANGSFLITFDKSLYMCAVFIVLCILSMIDAPKVFRGILVTGQYVPYFFLMYVSISIIKSKNDMNAIISILMHNTLMFSIMVFVLGLYFNNRAQLDNFLLGNFQIQLTKVLMYIELVFAVLVYKAFHGQLNKYESVVLAISVLGVIASGGRTNIGVMGVAFGFTFMTSKASLKKVLIVFGVMVCLVFMVFTTSYLQDRLKLMVVTGSKDYQDKITAFSRVYTTEVALEVIRRFPINGTGIGNLSSYTENVIKTMKGIPERILYYWNEHIQQTGGRPVFETTVTPMKFAAELGIGGLIFFFGFYYYLWYRITDAIRVAMGSLKTILSGMRLFVLISLVHNLLDPGITNYYSWLYYGLVIAGSRLAYLEREDLRLSLFDVETDKMIDN